MLLPLLFGYGINAKFSLPLLPKSQISALVLPWFWVTQHSTVMELVLVSKPSGRET